MHDADLYITPILLLAVWAVPTGLLMAVIALAAKSSLKPKVALRFAAILGGVGFVSLGLAMLGRTMLAGQRGGSDAHDVVAVGACAALVPVLSACLLLGRCFTEQRTWAILASGIIVGIGISAILAGVAGQEISRASSDAGAGTWVVTGLLVGAPVALTGLALLARSTRSATQA